MQHSVERDFARVYEDHLQRVYGFVAYSGLSRETVEDITQATFERALRAYSRFDPRRASETTWLLSIARHALIDLRRREQRTASMAAGPVESSVPGVDERYDGFPGLAHALAQHGERDREVIALRYGGDLSGPEIAEIMGLSLANVQQILSRSLRRMRATLEQQDPPLARGTAAKVRPARP